MILCRTMSAFTSVDVSKSSACMFRSCSIFSASFTARGVFGRLKRVTSGRGNRCLMSEKWQRKGHITYVGRIFIQLKIKIHAFNGNGLSSGQRSNKVTHGLIHSRRSRVKRADPTTTLRLVVDEHIWRCNWSTSDLSCFRLV